LLQKRDLTTEGMFIAKCSYVNDNTMYKYILPLLIVFAFAGCKKTSISTNGPVKNGNGGTDDNGNDGSGSYHVDFNVDDQTVLTSVKADTLFLTFQENVSIMLNPKDFENSSAVHLKEDFAKSGLAAYEYKILNEDHVYRYNSVDDNLNNNKIFLTAATVTVNGVKYTKLTLRRDFVFFRAYKLQDLAVEAQTNVLKVTTDKVSFSSYIYYDKKNSDPVISTANVIYKK
jgi:hypothetical protein